MKRIFLLTAVCCFWFAAFSARSAEIILTKHILPAAAPIDQPQGFVTPDGAFNLRDPNAPFHSDLLADAMGLDADGKNSSGRYLNLNHAIYTSYRLGSDQTPPRIILILMPGTWVGAMSLDQYSRDLIRLEEQQGKTGLEVWIIDRRSEQLEDHSGIRWAELNQGKIPTPEIIQGLSDYYRPAFTTEGEGKVISGKQFVKLDQNSVRFMANWGADTAIRDWREVVLQAHRVVGNQVVEQDGQMVIKKKPDRWVFIGGHSLGGSLTVLYASYDFDRRPDQELLGMNDVDGLVLLEGGGFKTKAPTVIDAQSYRSSLSKKYQDGMVYFDFDILGIQYAPPTMISLGISGWAADNARGMEATFPQYARPRSVQLPHLTNEAVLAYAMDDDFSPFFIARLSMGQPTGKIGRQFRYKTITVPADPNECRLLTAWKPAHLPMDPEFLYGWIPIDRDPKPLGYGKTGNEKCDRDADDSPEVVDFYAFAHAAYAGANDYLEAPDLSTGPNDYSEWYFPPRLSTDSGKIGSKIIEPDGTELFNGTHTQEIDLPVISFTGDDSMGQFSMPELTEKYFPPKALKHSQTQVHLIRGYTHMDITQATRNNQTDLKPGLDKFNAPAVYTFRFISDIIKW